MEKSISHWLLILAAALTLAGCGEPTYAQPSRTATPTPDAAVAELEQTSDDLDLHTLEKQTIEQFEKLAPSVVYVTNLGVRGGAGALPRRASGDRRGK